MASFLNKLLGKDEEKSSDTHSHSSDVICEGGTCRLTGGEKYGHKQDSKTVHTSHTGHAVDGTKVHNEGIHVTSTVSSDSSSTVLLSNQQRLKDLVIQLGSTHRRIDEYTKSQTEKINEDIQREIDEVVSRINQKHDDLVRVAHEQSAQIDHEYREQLQKMVEQIDGEKAQKIISIEQELNNQQADILQSARNDIDRLNQKAANLKIGVIQDAQARTVAEANVITAEAAHLDKASTIHQSTGTTTIKTEVSAAATTQVEGATTARRDIGGSTSSAEVLEKVSYSSNR